MKNLVAAALLFLSIDAFCGPNDSNLTNREQQVQDAEKSRNEMKQIEQATQPNSPSSPTQYKYDTSGIDSSVVFEINNHLLGYSVISNSDVSLSGIKVTGLMNVAYYSPSKEFDENGNETKGRFVFGFETPMIDITRQFAVFGGFGATLGDARGIYFDVGLDYRILRFLKAQAGFNYNTDGEFAPQLSAGLTW